MKKLLILSAIITLLGLGLFGCQQNPDSDSGGELALFLADKPVNDVAQVLVTIDEVQVKREDTQWETINDFSEEENGEKQFDLMDLRFNEELLGQEKLLEGNYNQIRLIVAANENEDGNENPGQNSGKSKVVYTDESGKADEDIFIPSGTQTGLKINHNFEITEDTITRLVLDADVSKIMHEAGDKIILRPTAINVIDKVVSGNIKGRVIAEDTDEAITESDVVIEALDDNDEVVTSTVALAEDESDSEEPAGSFLLRGLKEGTYNIKAYVVDDEGKIDESNYTETTVENIEVTAEETTEKDIVLNEAD